MKPLCIYTSWGTHTSSVFCTQCNRVTTTRVHSARSEKNPWRGALIVDYDQQYVSCNSVKPVVDCWLTAWSFIDTAKRKCTCSVDYRGYGSQLSYGHVYSICAMIHIDYTSKCWPAAHQDYVQTMGECTFIPPLYQKWTDINTIANTNPNGGPQCGAINYLSIIKESLVYWYTVL